MKRGHGSTFKPEGSVFDAALDRAGVVRVDNLRELFSAATTLSRRSLYRDLPPMVR